MKSRFGKTIKTGNMKMIFRYGLVLMLMIACSINVISVEASEGLSKGTAKKIVNQMYDYETYILNQNQGINRKTKLQFGKTEKVKAAALHMQVKQKDGIEKDEFGEYVVYKISEDKLKKMSKKMFGVAYGKKYLETKEQPDSFVDAYLLEDGTPVKYVANGETEIDYVKHGLKITKNSKGTYCIKQNVYYGYWGANTGQSNYQIVYTVKKNQRAKYGYAVSAISLKPLTQ